MRIRPVVVKLADHLYDTNYVYHSDPSVKGPAVVQQQVGMYRAAFPDLHLTLEDVFAAGDKVVVRFRATGTHKGDLMGLGRPASRSASSPSASSVSPAGRSSRSGRASTSSG